MAEEVVIHYKFRNRKTGDFKEVFIKIPDVEKYAIGHKKLFDSHEYRVCERRLLTKEEFDKKPHIY